MRGLERRLASLEGRVPVVVSLEDQETLRVGIRQKLFGALQATPRKTAEPHHADDPIRLALIAKLVGRDAVSVGVARRL